ncbi:hypothetical protein TNCV_1088371 [Trichonephila clavipes]|uniref:Uncharacterized protein n=1 Tax=Trichonephila clavipes TaxID=2585209 RepID=A0A8X6SZ93_TRICX|nr:hypothetical protein TNCV_1088371 [Trichonephila clavipes]
MCAIIVDKYVVERPFGIVVSDAECGVVGSGCQAASPLVWLMEGEEKWEASDHTQSVFLQNWGGTEQNYTVTCMVLKAKANDRRKNPALSREEFRGP